MIKRLKKRTAPAAAGTLFLLLGLAACGGGGSAGDGRERIDKASQYSLDETLARLTAGIRDANLVLVNEIDYQTMLGMVNMETEGLRSYDVFHPRYGARLFGTDRTAGLEAPFRIFVRADGNGAVLSYYRPSSILAPYGGMGDLGSELDEVFATMTDRATQ